MVFETLFSMTAFLAGWLPAGVDSVNQSTYRDCQPIEWHQSVVKEGHFEGNLSVACMFKGLGEKGLLALNEKQVSDLMESEHQIHSGPNEENYEQLPSQHFHLTLSMTTSSGDKITIEGDSHFAANEEQLLHHFISRRVIKATGNAKWLRQTSDRVDITQILGHYRLRIESGLKVKKPLFISESAFRKRIQQAAHDEMQSASSRLAEEYAQYLQP